MNFRALHSCSWCQDAHERIECPHCKSSKRMRGREHVTGQIAIAARRFFCHSARPDFRYVRHFEIIYVVAVVLLMFGAAIFIHEFGHFWVALKRGLKVEEFAIGRAGGLEKEKEAFFILFAPYPRRFCEAAANAHQRGIE